MKTADPTLLNDADFTVQVTPARVEKPASRWRNDWRAISSFHLGEVGDVGHAFYEGGEDYEDVELYPSKDAAETAAIEWLIGTGGDDMIGPDLMVWLGAHAVEGDA